MEAVIEELSEYDANRTGGPAENPCPVRTTPIYKAD